MRKPDDEENATARIAPCLAVCPPAVVDMSVPTFPGLVLTDNAPRCTFIALLSEQNRKGGRCFGEKKNATLKNEEKKQPPPPLSAF